MTPPQEKKRPKFVNRYQEPREIRLSFDENPPKRPKFVPPWWKEEGRGCDGPSTSQIQVSRLRKETSHALAEEMNVSRCKVFLSTRGPELCWRLTRELVIGRKWVLRVEVVYLLGFWDVLDCVLVTVVLMELEKENWISKEIKRICVEEKKNYSIT